MVLKEGRKFWIPAFEANNETKILSESKQVGLRCIVQLYEHILKQRTSKALVLAVNVNSMG